jgi:hypothetical protein
VRRGLGALLAFCLTPAAALAAAGDNSINGGGSNTNKSGTITAASTSQVVIAANPNRIGCEIQAIGGADLWIGIDTAASNGAGSWWLPAGSLYRCGNGTAIPTGAVSVWSTTAGAAFTAKEFSR